MKLIYEYLSKKQMEEAVERVAERHGKKAALTADRIYLKEGMMLDASPVLVQAPCHHSARDLSTQR